MKLNYCEYNAAVNDHHPDWLERTETALEEFIVRNMICAIAMTVGLILFCVMFGQIDNASLQESTYQEEVLLDAR